MPGLDDATRQLVLSLQLSITPGVITDTSAIPVHGIDGSSHAILRLRRPTSIELPSVMARLRHNSSLGTISGVAAPLKLGVTEDFALVWSLYNTASYSPITPKVNTALTLTAIAEAANTLVAAGVHGNLKPGNLLVSSESHQPLLIDFDSQRVTTDQLLERLDEALLFQPHYLRKTARETVERPRRSFLRNSGRQGHDAFALAAMCIYLLYGSAPSLSGLLLAANDREHIELWEAHIAYGVSASLSATLRAALYAELEDRDDPLDNLVNGLTSCPEANLTATKLRRLKHKGWNFPATVQEAAAQESAAALPDASAGDQDKAEEPSAAADTTRDLNELLPPERSAAAINAALDRYVIGQEHAKKEFSVLLSMHLTWFEEQNRLHKPPNAVLIGPTGVGKTHSLRTAAEYLRIPYTIIDATSLVPSGIVGYQVEDAVEDLVAAAGSILAKADRPRVDDDDIALAERGIVFFDEFDKLARSEDQRDAVGREQVQRRLLKAIEGTVMSVGQTRHTDRQRRHLDTSGLLFVASGAFDAIETPRIRNQRPDRLQRTLRSSEGIISADLISYGFLPELVARLQTIIRFVGLTVDQLENILRNSEITPIAVWKNHFARLGKELIVTDGALRAVAQRAEELALGARGLQTILFPLLSETAYDFEASNDEKFVLDSQNVHRGRRVGS